MSHLRLRAGPGFPFIALVEGGDMAGRCSESLETQTDLSG